ncbi:YHYH protein [Leptospira sp. WS92.C1]
MKINSQNRKKNLQKEKINFSFEKSNSNLKKGFGLILMLGLVALAACKPKESDDTTALAVAVAAISANTAAACVNTASTNVAGTCGLGAVVIANDDLGFGGPTCNTNIHADAPCWMKENFHCVTITISGSNYVIQTNNLPPYKSFYYQGANAAFNEAIGSGRHGNPNAIAAQNITFTIPTTPTCTSNLNSTSGAGLDALGVTVHGVVMFNNQAAPGDSLATEYLTMDQSEGHPQNTGKYHHHTEPYKITQDGSELVGIMLDGFPIYGKKTQEGIYPTLDNVTHTRTCTTTHFPNGTYCYHVGNGTDISGYLIGSYFRGVKGTAN